jgi:8-oxo-dGTP pyrophosphatase MutT (NUDIX family)
MKVPTTPPRFNPRVSAVVLRGDSVLLHRAERDAFWALPGGRIEPGEFAEDALVREIMEELGLEARAGRLLWLVENFFRYGGTSFHEFGFTFLTDVTGLGPEDEFRGLEPHLIFRWFDVGSLDGVDFRPAALKEGMRRIPESPQHLRWRDMAQDGAPG